MSGLALRAYKRVLSPLLHGVAGSAGACRFQPTCSEYAALAVAERGWLRGSGLALWRVLRCHPFARGGFDPVPGTYPVKASTATEAPISQRSQTLHLP